MNKIQSAVRSNSVEAGLLRARKSLQSGREHAAIGDYDVSKRYYESCLALLRGNRGGKDLMRFAEAELREVKALEECLFALKKPKIGVRDVVKREVKKKRDVVVSETAGDKSEGSLLDIPPQKKRRTEEDNDNDDEEEKDGQEKEEECKEEESSGFKPSNPRDIELCEIVSQDVLEAKPNVRWDDIAGLEDAKRLLFEAVIWPITMPGFFTGIRRPWKGVLLFGPPGTGKTMLARAVATECETTFFNVSSTTIASKWRGDAERMLLFEMARYHAPSVIFIDEIDSICSSRGEASEHEASRRVKSELLTQIDGLHSGEAESNVVVVGATNFPWELDVAIRRRLEKRVYIPLPDAASRKTLFMQRTNGIQLAEDVDLDCLVALTEGFSGADIDSCCRDAALEPARRRIAGLTPADLRQLDSEELSCIPVAMEDFRGAIARTSASVGQEEISRYAAWMNKFGSS